MQRGWLYQSHDAQVSVYVTNFWNIDPSLVGSFQAVLDIDALASLHKKHHLKYVETLRSLMDKNSWILMKGLETFGLKTYEAGGAHCHSLLNMKELFNGFCVECLEKKKVGSKLYQNTFYLSLK